MADDVPRQIHHPYLEALTGEDSAFCDAEDVRDMAARLLCLEDWARRAARNLNECPQHTVGDCTTCQLGREARALGLLDGEVFDG